MFETPLTCPQQKNDVGGSFVVQRSQTIPYSQSGIVIREPIIRLVSPQTEARCKGKEKAVATEGNKCGRDVQFLLPETSTNNGVGGGNGESSRAVRRRLFEDPMEANNAAIGRDGQTETQADPIESPTTAEPSGVAQQSSLYTWTRFQDLLHDLLNDESTEPVLFARDAAPVIDSGEVDGIDAALEAIPYEGDNLFVGQ
ncbi:hypothetical protein HID58_033750, partial [Brassica napus]